MDAETLIFGFILGLVAGVLLRHYLPRFLFPHRAWAEYRSTVRHEGSRSMTDEERRQFDEVMRKANGVHRESSKLFDVMWNRKNTE